MKSVTKKTKHILLVLALSSIAIIGGTIAYYMSREEFNNELRVGTPGVAVEEKFNPADFWVPGEKKEKEVWFSNTGEVDMLLRFRINAEWETGKEPKDEKNQKVTPEPDPLDPVNPLVMLNWNVTDKTTDPDGSNDETIKDFTKITGTDGSTYYYYNKILKRAGEDGSSTDKILEAVTFSKDISNDGHGIDYSDTQINLSIYGETVVVNSDAAKDTWGVEPVIDLQSGMVTWKQ